MAGNVLSGGTDVVASTPETSSRAAQVVAVFALSAAIATGQDARAADIGVNMTEAKNVCMAESRELWSKLLVLAEKKKAAGETDKAVMIQTKYEKEMVEADKTCDTLVTAKANIAKNEAEIVNIKAETAKFADVRDTGIALNQEIQARLALVDSFSEGDPAKANDNVAFLNRGRAYLAKAREVFKDPESITRLAQLENNINMLATRFNPGSKVQIAATR